MPGEKPPDPNLVSSVIDQYDTSIVNVDALIETVLQRLRRNPNTLVILTSDHGEYFGEHALVEHAKDVYEAALHVPLIVKAPGQHTSQTPIVWGGLPEIAGEEPQIDQYVPA